MQFMMSTHRGIVLLAILFALNPIALASPLTNNDNDNKHILNRRHSYALICALSSTMTRQCSSSPLFYYCTASGALAQNFPKGGPFVVNDTCEEYCECFDTSPGPPKANCIINIDGSATCNGKEVIGIISNISTTDTASIEAVPTSSESVTTPVVSTASSSTTQAE